MDQTQSDQVSPALPSAEPSTSTSGPLAGACIVAAFQSALLVALLSLLLASPLAPVGPYVAGPVLLLAWLAASAHGARRITTPVFGRRLGLSAATGAGTAALLLIFLGSLLTKPVVAEAATAASGQAVAELRPDAPLIAGGFLLLGAIVGLLGGVASKFLPPARRPAWPWPARMAATTVVAAIPLIVLGGLVTSTESGMAVPDWPGSYGMNMVLFPLGLMAQPRIFLEHSHRLFGVLVGVCTIVTALSAQFSGPGRRAPGVARAAAWVALVLVILQGVLGGTRVTENSAALAIFHAILAQIFLTLMACLAAMLTPAWAGRPASRRGVARMAVTVLILFLVQLALGAAFRHIGTRAWHAIATHAVLAIVLVVLAPILGARLGKSDGDLAPPAASKRIGKGLMHATGLQFLLGWGALAGAWMGQSRGPVPLHTQLAEARSVPLWETILTTAHQVNGALLLMLVGLAVVWSLARRGAGEPSHASVDGGADSYHGPHAREHAQPDAQ